MDGEFASFLRLMDSIRAANSAMSADVSVPAMIKKSFSSFMPGRIVFSRQVSIWSAVRPFR